MRKKIVAGNWKMNNNLEQTKLLIEGLLQQKLSEDTRIMLAPTFTNLQTAVTITQGSSLEIIAQNMYFAESGAYTGEISADMLLSVGVKVVILGHSERRSYFGEDDASLAKKVNTALNKNMEVVFCLGEELEERKSGRYFDVVASQLKNALFHLEEAHWKSIILAYEPVWAIGTGETASAKQAQQMHQFIRKTLADRYNKTLADNTSILYGGSVKPNNAKEIFSKPDVDGGLIGGASLKIKDFSEIVKSI